MLVNIPHMEHVGWETPVFFGGKCGVGVRKMFFARLNFSPWENFGKHQVSRGKCRVDELWSDS